MPAPGTYDNRSERIKGVSVSASIGTEARGDKNLSKKARLPGPADINLSEDWTREKKFKRTSGGKFQKERRAGFSAALSASIDVPGPANYNLQDFKKERGPSYSMNLGKGRSSGKKVADNPGPGTYNSKVDIVKQNLGKTKIGREKRSNKLSENPAFVPGPGTYDAPAS